MFLERGETILIFILSRRYFMQITLAPTLLVNAPANLSKTNLAQTLKTRLYFYASWYCRLGESFQINNCPRDSAANLPLKVFMTADGYLRLDELEQRRVERTRKRTDYIVSLSLLFWLRFFPLTEHIILPANDCSMSGLTAQRCPVHHRQHPDVVFDTPGIRSECSQPPDGREDQYISLLTIEHAGLDEGAYVELQKVGKDMIT